MAWLPEEIKLTQSSWSLAIAQDSTLQLLWYVSYFLGAKASLKIAHVKKNDETRPGSKVFSLERL